MLCRNSHFICKHVKHYKQRTPICTRTHIRTVGRPPKTHTYAAVVGENSLSIKFYSKLNLRPLNQGGRGWVGKAGKAAALFSYKHKIAENGDTCCCKLEK